MTQTQTGHSPARDPNHAIQEIMDVIDSLKGVYARETEALNGADARRFLDLQDEKLATAKKYQEKIEEAMSRKDEMKVANPLIKKRLAEMEKEFYDLSEKNIEALQRMQRSTERLGETIMGAAKNSVKQMRAVSYGETGAFHADEKKTVSMGVSETA